MLRTSRVTQKNFSRPPTMMMALYYCKTENLFLLLSESLLMYMFKAPLLQSMIEIFFNIS